MTPPRFTPAWWLPGAHAQTIYGAIFATAPRIAFRRERWDTPDGDFVDVDFVDGPAASPWVHLFHGLEGSSDSPSPTMRMPYRTRRCCRGSILTFRGRSGGSTRLPRVYHSGDSDEIDWVLRRFRERLERAPVYVVGVSLGGNAFAKWLGETGEAARDIVDRAAVVSAPVDLMAAGDALEKGFALFYARHFLTTLKKNSLAKLERFPGLFDGKAVVRARTLREFDDAFTAPVHGFRDCDDYYLRSSAKAFLPAIQVPTLLVNARDDPFLPESALPTQREVSAAVTLEFPARGGHVGFVSGIPGNIEWLPRRIFHFFEHHE
jgi:predicted alpha/beta-fold hydrolase